MLDLGCRCELEKRFNPGPLDEDGVPARRQEEQEDLEMTNVLDDTVSLVAGAAAELGGGREAQGPFSPVKDLQRAKRPAGQGKSQVRREAKKWLLSNSYVSVERQEGQEVPGRRQPGSWQGTEQGRPRGGAERPNDDPQQPRVS